MTSVDKVQTEKKTRTAQVKKMKLDVKFNYELRQGASTSYAEKHFTNSDNNSSATEISHNSDAASKFQKLNTDTAALISRRRRQQHRL